MIALNGPVVFKPGVGEEPTCFHGIRQPTKVKCECSCKAIELLGLDQDTGHGNVELHDGEFQLHSLDLEIVSRGFNWKFERTYRNGINFNGPLGHNWEFNYNRRLFIEAGGSVLRMDGYGRADRYELVGGSFKAPTGFYTQLVRNTDKTFIEKDRSRTQVLYAAPDGKGIARMKELRDRNGNRMQFKYNPQGQLVEVIDTLGRSIAYHYNAENRLTDVEDFVGRKIRFEYNSNDDLIAVTSPAVTGTPHENDFPEGKTTRYRYSTGSPKAGPPHNVLEITAPNEVASGGSPRVRVEYEIEKGSPNLGRVLRQTLGGVNANGVPAGGTISYEYLSLAKANTSDLKMPSFQTTVTDRNGNQTEYQFNQFGNVIRIGEFANRIIRKGDPKFFETQMEYNQDGEMTRLLQAEGNSIEYIYDVKNPDRLQQGNLLAEIRRPDSKRGGDQEFIKTTFTYEPIFNQRRTVTEARGNDPAYVPQNGGKSSPERYTQVYIFDYQEGDNLRALATVLGVSEGETRNLLARANISLGLGDVNGDGRKDQIAGNIVKIIYPTVNLLPDSNMAQIEGGTKQPVEEAFGYNGFGQMSRHRDAEGNVTLYDYYPENDPDGDGANFTTGVGSEPFGYLKEIVRDAESNPIRNSGRNPTPVQIKERYSYDPVGNIRRKIDGRGVATDYLVNELNQVFGIIRAADVSQALLNPHEPNWRNCTDPTLIECTHGMVAFRYMMLFKYDANNNMTQRAIENRDSNNKRLQSTFITHEFRYDILDNAIEGVRQVSDDLREGVVTKYRYDRNENRVLEISPVANLPAGHPHHQPSNIVSYVFDERDLLFASTQGGLTGQFRALEAHADVPEKSGIPDTPGALTITHRYNGNRKLSEVIKAADKTGNGNPRSTNYLYDGFDRPVSIIDAVGNQQFMQYDPADNIVRVSRFGPVGGPSPANNHAATFGQPLNLGEFGQPLLSQIENKYDERARQFERNNRLFVYQGVTYHREPLLADGPLGQSGDGWVTNRYEYDRLGRQTFVLGPDRSTIGRNYDGLGRVAIYNDPEGNQVILVYDDDSNPVKRIEIEITQRDAVKAGRVPDLQESFTTIYAYDSLNRRIRTTDNLGQTTRYGYDSRNNSVFVSDAQHSNDSEDLITDPLGIFPAPGQDSRGVTRINRPGNTMEFLCDGLNRRIAGVLVLRVDGQGKNPIDLTNPSNPDGRIVFDYEWDANSRLIAIADDGIPTNQNTSVGVIESINPQGNVIRFSYTHLNRFSRAIFPDGSIIGHIYNFANHLDTRFDQNGSRIHFNYNSVDLVESIVITPATSTEAHPLRGFKDPRVSWQVTGTRLQKYLYDGLYRLVYSEDADMFPEDDANANVVTFAYDSLDRLVEEVQKKRGEGGGHVVSSVWDGADNRIGLIYPSGRAIRLTYDMLRRIKTVRDQGAREVIVNYDYIGGARVLERRYINGVRLSYLRSQRGGLRPDVGYDGLKRVVLHSQLRQIAPSRPGGEIDQVIARFGYSYDRANNKLSEVKQHDNNQRGDYFYDSIYRLVAFSRQGEPEESWALDGVNNWTGHRGVFNQINRLNEYTAFAGVPQLYDANGNLIDDGVNRYEYDVCNRLRTVIRKAENRVIATYRYDAQDRRTDKDVINGSIRDGIRYFSDFSNEVEERQVRLVEDRTRIVTRQYVYGTRIDEPLTLNSSDGAQGVTLFYLDDGKGCIAALTDRQGVIRERYTYDGYGMPLFKDSGGATLPGSTVANPFLFAGRRYDPETGFYYFRHRYLDPRAGRFTTRDPLGLLGDIANLGNSYTYVNNNPINNFDPVGLDQPTVSYTTTDCLDPNAHPERGPSGVKCYCNIGFKQGPGACEPDPLAGGAGNPPTPGPPAPDPGSGSGNPSPEPPPPTPPKPECHCNRDWGECNKQADRRLMTWIGFGGSVGGAGGGALGKFLVTGLLEEITLAGGVLGGVGAIYFWHEKIRDCYDVRDNCEIRCYGRVISVRPPGT
jgi:RHS repeat-associated protein